MGSKNAVNNSPVMRNFECPILRNLERAAKSEGRNKKPEKFGTVASVPPLRV
jgi:hypothetical protein